MADRIDIDALRSELSADPAGLGYEGKTPAECRQLLRTATLTVDIPASVAEIRNYLMTTVHAHAALNPSNVPIYWVLKRQAGVDVKAEILWDLLNSAQATIPMTGYWRTKVLVDLRDAGYFNGAKYQDLLNLGRETTSRGVALFGRLPTEIEISLARAR